jgi:membrane-associated phospholipid phosphatase
VLRLRSSEWLAVSYFFYVGAVAPFYIAAPWRTWAVASAVAAMFWLFSLRPNHIRNFLPLPATLTAYREMNWFTPAVRDYHLERSWIVWDRWLLNTHGLRNGIEAAGALLPRYLELCYLLVYTVGAVALVVLMLNGAGKGINRFWLVYLAGTLGAYALFPYFRSEPPRTVFPGMDVPHVVTALRSLNLWIVGGYGIHSSVFPSAHVSSAFSAAWGLLDTLPEKPWIGWAMAFYAASVGVAAVYGRYHYAVDVVAGLGVSMVALAAVRGASRA